MYLSGKQVSSYVTWDRPSWPGPLKWTNRLRINIMDKKKILSNIFKRRQIVRLSFLSAIPIPHIMSPTHISVQFYANSDIWFWINPACLRISFHFTYRFVKPRICRYGYSIAYKNVARIRLHMNLRHFLLWQLPWLFILHLLINVNFSLLADKKENTYRKGRKQFFVISKLFRILIGVYWIKKVQL